MPPPSDSSPLPIHPGGGAVVRELASVRTLLQDSLNAVVDGFVALVDSAPLGVITLDNRLRYNRVNSSVADLGLPAAELLNRTPGDIIATDAPAPVFLEGLPVLLSGRLDRRSNISVRAPRSGNPVTIDILRRIAMAESHQSLIYAVLWKSSEPWKEERAEALMENLRYADVLAATQERLLRVARAVPSPAAPEHDTPPLHEGLGLELAALLTESGNRLAAGIEALVDIQSQRADMEHDLQPELHSALLRIDSTLRTLVDVTDQKRSS